MEQWEGAITGKMDYWVTQPVNDSLNTQGLMFDAVAFGSTKSPSSVLVANFGERRRAVCDITKGRFLRLTVSAYVF